MSSLALNIDMRDRLVVVVGGGAVALRKVRTLLAAGARVRVVAEQFCPELVELCASYSIAQKTAEYQPADLEQTFLVVAATNSRVVNERVCRDARSIGVLAMVVDNPAAGDCTFPALLKRGDLEIAVSTGGRCPTFAVDVRDRIAGVIGKEYAEMLDLLAAEREKLLTNGSPSTYNTKVLRSLATHLFAELTERKEPAP
jgi:precorrin-2 dehydrogenase/sirohydrochlorin ferrochelatase